MDEGQRPGRRVKSATGQAVRARWAAEGQGIQERLDEHGRRIDGLTAALEGVFLATQPQAPAPAERRLRLVEPGPDDTGPITVVA
jgi:hypothetical protein